MRPLARQSITAIKPYEIISFLDQSPKSLGSETVPPILISVGVDTRVQPQAAQSFVPSFPHNLWLHCFPNPEGVWQLPGAIICWA